MASDSVPTAGVVTIDAEAWNYNQIIGRAATVSVTAVQGGTSDIQPPSVRIASITSRGATLTDLTRIELTDSVNVEVDAYDNGGAGLRRMGLTVIAVPSSTIPGLRPDTLQVTFVPAQGGQATNIFRVLPRDFGLDERIARLGGAYNVQLQFTAFALDTLSQCGATAQIGAFESIACVPASGSFYTATGRTGVTRTIALVGGKTVSLPNGGKIADVAVDQNREKLYLSNITQNKVEILRMSDTTFAATGGSNSIGLVGSQPWGLFLNYHGGVYDTLMVANSGSTTISFLVVDDTRPDYLREHLARRLLTPNEVLWEVKTTLTQTALRYKGSFYDFSDRPQFVAQDVAGRTLFSTVPTGSAPDGTLRMADPAHSAPVLEPGLLFNSAAVVPTEDIMAIASLDSLKVVAGGAVDDSILMYDHVPGQPNNVIRTPNPMTLAGAVAYMQTHGSDMRTFAGKWDVTKVGMSDTTFMAVSGDRTAVAFGEGATSPTGRIMLWDGVAGGVSNEVSVVDLVHNASERVFGLGLDADGQFGVARGALGAYFFTGRPPASGTPQPLRLQGLFNTPGSAGGAALHPTHSGGPTSAVNALAFISTPNHSVKILDSAHFYERGEIQLRDNVVGPVKAALPFSGDNAGLLPADPSYVLVKLFCVTADAAGKTQVVVVNVRNKDLTN